MPSPLLNSLDLWGRKCQQGFTAGSLFLLKSFFLVFSSGLKKIYASDINNLLFR